MQFAITVAKYSVRHHANVSNSRITLHEIRQGTRYLKISQTLMLLSCWIFIYHMFLLYEVGNFFILNIKEEICITKWTILHPCAISNELEKTWKLNMKLFSQYHKNGSIRDMNKQLFFITTSFKLAISVYLRGKIILKCCLHALLNIVIML